MMTSCESIVLLQLGQMKQAMHTYVHTYIDFVDAQLIFIRFTLTITFHATKVPPYVFEAQQGSQPVDMYKCKQN